MLDNEKFPMPKFVPPVTMVLLIIMAVIMIVLTTIYVFERDAYVDELQEQAQYETMMENQNGQQ